MLWFLRLVFLWILPRLGSDPYHQRDLALEVLALRQQNAVLQRQGHRVRLTAPDRAFWVCLRSIWPRWKEACALVKPETVIRWHRAGFKHFWTWKSRRRPPGRPRTAPDVRALALRMAQENPLWGAPRIHGELLKLGLKVSERTVSRWLPKPLEPGRRQSWRTFLENHREVLAAMDFLVVPTWNFGLLHILVIIHHGRRTVLHANVTSHPTAQWVKQQLREAFPFDEIPKYLVFDRGSAFSAVKGFVASLGITPKLTAYRSPWQNGACERLIGTLRRELFDHVIVLNEEHARRLLKDYLRYYHADRTHLALAKDSPQGRAMESAGATRVVAHSRCGGLHHRYSWDCAA